MPNPDQQPKATYSADSADLTLKSKAMDLEHGLLGKLFGSTKNAPLNIAGAFLLGLLVPGIVLLFCDGKLPASDYWKLILPVTTLILGYLFGRRTD